MHLGMELKAILILIIHRLLGEKYEHVFDFNAV